MAGTFKFSWNAEGTIDGVSVEPWGSRTSPVKEVSLTGSDKYVRTITVPVVTSSAPYPNPTLLWEYADTQTFDHLILQVRGGEGYLRLAWLADKPTSSSDLTAAGTHIGCSHCELSCQGIFMLTTDEATVYANAMRATAHDLDGSDYPTFLTDFTNAVRGRIYKLWAQNTSTTDPVVVDIYARN